MKKFNLALLIALVGICFYSCTPQSLNDGDTQATDKPKICPVWDGNCNGIPDDEE